MSGYREPIRILSDLHVGHPASMVERAGQIAGLLAGAGTVVFNGDSVETRRTTQRAAGERFLAECRERCAAAGVELVLVSGNHDPDLSSLNHLDLCGGAVLVTHGDLMFQSLAPWSAHAAELSAAHRSEVERLGGDRLLDFEARLSASRRAVMALRLADPPMRRGLAARVATVAWLAMSPLRLVRVLGCWATMGRRAARLAEVFRPAARIVVVGHLHRAGVWRVRGRVVINTGSFTPLSGLRVVEIGGGRLEVRRVAAGRGEAPEYGMGGVEAAFSVP